MIIHMPKIIRSLLYTIHKIKSRWTEDLNVKSKIFKLLEENIREYFADFHVVKDFFKQGSKSTNPKNKDRLIRLH